ncbi:MAG TPA: long-chain-fatty-acid--CoA ligase [Noviherbaspirillum sp.]|uniref:long-chain-fatty-acid--CoA ligase n=1 Tax=Noviherbaspirillum sp. TaxID=1926288 RepID=UPI002B49BE05|nr:long-chain-fatty-acid--CoA ligase [Noviherbaspirillum sp.]HJV87753.1 long-chain-fatty-acid--CoA ligase [Noviherbaspirillum sp.]
MGDKTLVAALRRQNRERPDATAYIAPERTWTFSDLQAESNRVAQGLATLGVGPGDRVACLTKHTAEAVVLLLAANKLGAVGMPVNWRLAPPEIEYVLNLGEAKFLMVDEFFLPAVQKTNTPSVRLTVATDRGEGLDTFNAWRARFTPEDTGYEGAPDDTALQLFSSGTTGLPKGIELTHRNMLLINRGYADGIGYVGGKSVFLNALPTFHIAGMNSAFMPMIEGGVAVMHPDFDPVHVIEAIKEHRITHTFVVPAMILFMLQAPNVAQGDFSSLQIIAYGGSPASEKLMTDAQHTFRCGLLQIYGMTETAGTLTSLSPEDHDPNGPRAHLLRSAGKPIPGVELRIVSPGSFAEVKENEVGEIWVRTLQNMKGYWRNPKATAEVFPHGRDEHGGWLRTGDAGYVKDGYLYIHDRIKDMIISGGENIYPAEVENALANHPAVAEYAVIGVPDERWGEAVKACVTLKAGMSATPQDIIDFTRERLAHYKCPKSVDIMDVLPRNPSGKVLKRILREPYWKGAVRQVS